ncbi:pantetheine-phosphate adenylyltransferase [bacterium]|nr:pantetheine-phosphate adenylyltransferase [bacterium]|tara:strand:- start:5661 stop:6143 length:483 start_codon:yes stop_codon:yes gene_type:complete
MAITIYPGSFDPVHHGHVRIVETAATMFDQVIVVAMQNREKKGFLSIEKRQELLKTTFGHLDNVVTESSTGLVVDVAKALNADTIIKGLRSSADFEIEMQMAQTNKKISQINTIFIPTDPEYSYISSRFIREIASEGGDVSGLVPKPVSDLLKRGLGNNE